jgi:hypothetical protein
LINAIELGVTVTSNNGVKTLADLIAEGVFDSADIRVDNDLTRLQASEQPDESGRFSIVRPSGEIDIFVYIFQGDHYQIYPLQDGYVFSEPDELGYDLEMVSFAIQVLKNGQPMPDSENLYSRGSLAIRDRNDWRVDVRYDIGAQGDTYDTFTMKTGQYLNNFTSGYGQVFPFLQYVYVECLEVATQ